MTKREYKYHNFQKVKKSLKPFKKMFSQAKPDGDVYFDLPLEISEKIKSCIMISRKPIRNLSQYTQLYNKRTG